ncbi:hypothetical protein CL655_00905 [bacterium]|nr:hypothetical protein [bacterium]
MGVCVLTAPLLTLAYTSVSNSVSVSASGGESSASVTTIINGDVVESFEKTTTDGEPIEYQHTVTATSNQSVTTIETNTVTHDRAALMQQLRALLLAYVLRFQ